MAIKTSASVAENGPETFRPTIPNKPSAPTNPEIAAKNNQVHQGSSEAFIEVTVL
ncbi:MAG: hypothetical protein WAN14_08735 [Candidatus Acidiferrales bacterium]